MNELTFTTDWTTNNTESWLRTLLPYIGKRDVLALEVGTWEGRSTAWFLEHIVTGENARLFTVDRDHSRFAENREILLSAYPGHLVAEESESKAWLLEHAYGGTLFDFIYLDAPKDAGDLLAQAVLCWEVLKPGGILIFDDYLWPGDGPNPFPNAPRHYSNPPRLGIDAFLNTHYLRHDRLHQGWQIIVRKK
jgi:predicted O-methyltransferase YrrM